VALFFARLSGDRLVRRALPMQAKPAASRTFLHPVHDFN